MSISRYDPFRDLRTLQTKSTVFSPVMWLAPSMTKVLPAGSWSPARHYENKDQIVLEAELPGMKREDFDLSV